jgi:hypothetical protein
MKMKLNMNVKINVTINNDLLPAGGSQRHLAQVAHYRLRAAKSNHRGAAPDLNEAHLLGIPRAVAADIKDDAGVHLARHDPVPHLEHLGPGG